MFEIHVKPEIREHVDYLLKNVKFNGRPEDSIKSTGFYAKNGKIENKRVGLIAQCSIIDFLGKPWPMADSFPCDDHGIDIDYNNLFVDIKCRRIYNNYPDDENSINDLYCHQHHRPGNLTMVYLFAMLLDEQNRLFVNGLIWKSRIADNPEITITRKGFPLQHWRGRLAMSDNYNVPTSALVSANNAEEFLYWLNVYQFYKYTQINKNV